MKIIIISSVLVAVIAFGASFILGGVGLSTESQNTGSSVRLDSPSK